MGDEAEHAGARRAVRCGAAGAREDARRRVEEALVHGLIGVRKKGGPLALLRVGWRDKDLGS